MNREQTNFIMAWCFGAGTIGFSLLAIWNPIDSLPFLNVVLAAAVILLSGFSFGYISGEADDT